MIPPLLSSWSPGHRCLVAHTVSDTHIRLAVKYISTLKSSSGVYLCSLTWASQKPHKVDKRLRKGSSDEKCVRAGLFCLFWGLNCFLCRSFCALKNYWLTFKIYFTFFLRVICHWQTCTKWDILGVCAENVVGATRSRFFFSFSLLKIRPSCLRGHSVGSIIHQVIKKAPNLNGRRSLRKWVNSNSDRA